MKDLVKKNILGIDVTDATCDEILEFIVESVKNKEKPYYVVTPNPEIIVAAAKNPQFRSVLNNAKIASNDGVGLGVAATFLGKSLKSRTTGVDLVEKLCEKVANWPITVGFLGAGPKVAERASERLQNRYPNLKVNFIAQEWGKEGFDLVRKYQVASSTYNAKERKIHNTKSLLHNTDVDKVDILFVALGAPKQEMWMAEYIGKIPARVMIGVGGAFDYISGRVVRAPKIFRSLGLEWLFRLAVQPWRWKRQLALVEFVWMVVKEKITR